MIPAHMPPSRYRFNESDEKSVHSDDLFCNVPAAQAEDWRAGIPGKLHRDDALLSG